MDKVIIPFSGSLNAQECLWFLNRGFDDCMYRVFPDRVRRAFDIDGEVILADIYLANDRLELHWLNGTPSPEGISGITQFVSEWFDLETDLTAFYRMLENDARLGYMANTYSGLRLIGMPDLCEALAWSIIGQQINLTFAYAIKRRLVERYGKFIDYEGSRYFIFPFPVAIAALNTSELRELQLSEKKAEYLITTANAFTENKLSRDILMKLPDAQSRIKFLTNIRGIGPWTANYVLLKCLKEPSSIPHRDAGLLNALIKHHIIKDKSDDDAIAAFFKSFSGWESYLVFYLWRSLSVNNA